MTSASPRERLIFTIARLLSGTRTVAVGAASPIPAAGAMLARALRAREGGEPLSIAVLGSARHNFFTGGSGELFDCAAQGRIDAFFLGGGEIDGAGNVNLVGTGPYPRSEVRWPGSFGAAFLYFVVPRVILFREEHSRRVLVEKVDFVTAPGTSPPHVHRTGGPYALLTGLALFTFDRQRARFRLQSVHAGASLEEVADRTGFVFDALPEVPTTPAPDAEALATLRGRVLDELEETYPAFAATLRAGMASGGGQNRFASG
jgi:glutaconate CoA-transferase, subunit B